MTYSFVRRCMGLGWNFSFGGLRDRRPPAGARAAAEDERLSSRPRGGGMGLVSFEVLAAAADDDDDDDEEITGSAVVAGTPPVDPASAAAAAAAPRRSPALGFATGFLGGMLRVDG